MFFGIILNEDFIDGATDETDGLLFEITGGVSDFLSFGFDVAHGIGWSDDVIPDFGESIHVERHVIYRFVMDSNWRIDVVVEIGELIDVLPDVFIISVKNVGTVFMDIDAVLVFGINVTSDVVTFVNDENGFAGSTSTFCNSGAKEAGSNN